MTESIENVRGAGINRRPLQNITTYPVSCVAAYFPLLFQVRQSSAEFLRDVRDISAISLLGHEYRHSDGDKITLQISPVA